MRLKEKQLLLGSLEFINDLRAFAEKTDEFEALDIAISALKDLNLIKFNIYALNRLLNEREK